MIFIRDTISSKKLEKHIFPNNFESIFVEFNFRKCKWLLCRTYHPPCQSDEYFLITLIRPLILIVDMIKFCLWWILTQEYWNSAQSLSFKEKTCFKNMQNPSCIYLLLTNNVYAFQQTTAIYTGLSDCHKPVLTILKTTVPRS